MQPWEHLKEPELYPLARTLLDTYKRAHPADPDLQRANKQPSCVSVRVCKCASVRVFARVRTSSERALPA